MLKLTNPDRGALLQMFPFAMSDSNAKPERCWQEITADAAQEPDPEKLLELSKELESALVRRKKTLHSIVEPGSNEKAG